MNNNKKKDEGADDNISDYLGETITKTKFYQERTRICGFEIKNKDIPKWKALNKQFKDAGTYMNTDGGIFMLNCTLEIVNTFFPIAKILDKDPIKYTSDNIFKMLKIYKDSINEEKINEIKKIQKNVIQEANINTQNKIQTITN